MKALFNTIVIIILLAIPTMAKAQTDSKSTSPLTTEDSLQLAWVEFEYIHEMENDIINYVQQINIIEHTNNISWSPQEPIYVQLYCLSESPVSWEELNVTADLWFEKLKSLLNRYPQSIYYPFEYLTKRTGISIVNSPDSVLRFYQWSANTDPDDAGMEHIIQVKRENGEIFAIEATGDPTGLESDLLSFMIIHQIIPLDTDSGRVYLMEYEAGPPQDGMSECISAFTIDEKWDAVNYVPLFLVGKELKSNLNVITHNAYGYSKYEKDNYVYKDSKEILVSPKDKWLLKYDQQKGTITMKDLDENGYPTGKVTTLKFDGKIFK